MVLREFLYSIRKITACWYGDGKIHQSVKILVMPKRNERVAGKLSLSWQKEMGSFAQDFLKRFKMPCDICGYSSFFKIINYMRRETVIMRMLR